MRRLTAALSVCLLLVACDDGTIPAGYRLEVVDGDGQVGEITAPAERRLVVRVLDLLDRPAAGVSVLWRVLEGGAGVPSTHVQTDVDGLASTSLTFGIDPGAVSVLAEAGGGSVRFRLEGERRWRGAGAGLAHSCALSSAGEAYCWGANYAAQLGDGSETSRFRPAPVAGSMRFATISLGWLHSCGVGLEGIVYCWGGNDSGQLGVGDQNPRHRPTPVPLAEPATAVSAGYQHSCAIGRSARAYCWGSNGGDALGAPVLTGVECLGTPCALTPAPVESEVRFVAVSAGEFHTCALAEDGSAYCWGWNSEGEVGTADVPGRSYPVPARVHGTLVFREIGAHARHTCALTTSGKAVCWGRAATGETGPGGWSPAELPGGLTFTTIATGSLYTCATTGDSRTACYGDQSGLTFSFEPRVFTDPPFTRVGIGSAHSCGVAGARVWCWGVNSHGQLGPEAAIGRHAEPIHVPMPR